MIATYWIEGLGNAMKSDEANFITELIAPQFASCRILV
jgi:hypothetical protein